MIFQEPLSSLNPCFTVGFQIIETLALPPRNSRASRPAPAPSKSLREVGISARRAADRVPFPISLSGGMNQRVMIAMAIACKPKLLIADEPTTALDVTIQAQILDLLLKLQRETGMALVLITHSMGVVAETAERVCVQYAGQKVEEQDVVGSFQRSTSSLHGRSPCRASRKGADEEIALNTRAWSRASSIALQPAFSLLGAVSPPICAATIVPPVQPPTLGTRSLPLPASWRPPSQSPGQ